MNVYQKNSKPYQTVKSFGRSFNEILNIAIMLQKSELEIKEKLNSIGYNVVFFGAYPITDINKDLYSTIGQYFAFAVGGHAGTSRASVMINGTYVNKELAHVDISYFINDMLQIKKIDYLWIDAENAEYGFFDIFYKDGRFAKNNIIFCQTSLEVHYPNAKQKSEFMKFIQTIVSEARFGKMNIEKTKEVFAGLIEKPQLTDQLLSRPPLKFIIDIVAAVIKSTGYLKNDFSKSELEGASADKQSKIEFLEKLIKLLDEGDLQNVKASKIIAGKDADDTNLLLQKLGMNARNFGGEAKEKKKKKSSSSKDKEKKSSKEEKSSKKDDSSEKREKRSRSVDKKDDAKEKKSKKSSDKSKDHKSKERSKSKDKHGSSESKESKLSKEAKEEKRQKKKVLKRGDSMIAMNGDVENIHDDEGYEEAERPSGNLIVYNDSATPVSQTATSPVKTDDSGMGDDSPRPPPPAERAALLRQATGAARPQTSMGRPGTASSRPAPPKIKKKQIATIDNTPQPTVELKSEIIQDTPNKDADNEDDNFIIEEEEVEAPLITSVEIGEEDRGALVQKIMDTKAEIEDGGIAKDFEHQENDNEEFNLEKEKIVGIRNKMQDVTKAAYPLARLFDFINDDIDAMMKELEKWRAEQRKNELEQQNRAAAGFGDSGRLLTIVTNLENDIQEIKTELSAARGRVLENDQRIKILLRNV
ncbi:unnamed protein product [Caenorhabditis bovis]|uniref:Methyltransferase FkbM domain-containing protein n=1 Tax=Caenorhabditis bovis TaxID=2654633 RepID=A0A8S1EJW8_9PELO|nr:unnamed protein product [Caenorhabditis bovis]